MGKLLLPPSPPPPAKNVKIGKKKNLREKKIKVGERRKRKKSGRLFCYDDVFSSPAIHKYIMYDMLICKWTLLTR